MSLAHPWLDSAKGYWHFQGKMCRSFEYFDDRRERARLFIALEGEQNLNYEGGAEFNYVLSDWQEGVSIESHHGHQFYVMRFRYSQP